MPKKPKKEEWRYLGRRLDRKNKVFYVWHDGEEERHFNKLPSKSPGSFYEVEVEKRKADGSIVVHGRPGFLMIGEKDDPITLKACADDRAVSIELETIRAEKAGAYLELEDHLEALRSLYFRQTGGRRAAFLAHVIQRLTKR